MTLPEFKAEIAILGDVLDDAQSSALRLDRAWSRLDASQLVGPDGLPLKSDDWSQQASEAGGDGLVAEVAEQVRQTQAVMERGETGLAPWVLRYLKSPQLADAIDIDGRTLLTGAATDSLMADRDRRSDQGEVWNLIAKKSARFSATSDTAAMSALFDKVGASLDDFVAAFPPAEHQLGAVFFINGRPAGLELFDAASTWRKLSPKLIRSYAVDALDRDGRQPFEKAGAEVSNQFATAVASMPASAFPAAGEGEDVRLTGADLAGAALVARGRMIHVSAFPHHA